MSPKSPLSPRCPCQTPGGGAGLHYRGAADEKSTPSRPRAPGACPRSGQPERGGAEKKNKTKKNRAWRNQAPPTNELLLAVQMPVLFFSISILHHYDFGRSKMQELNFGWACQNLGEIWWAQAKHPKRRILRLRLPRDCPRHQHLPAPLGSSPLGPTSISPGDCISQELSPGARTSPALFFS